ncbi:phosphotransferase [Nonomuraea sp. NPDC000554]|uniref:phosphotransferase n=1 Tax=Nonomuraea sp. NPDC000554 TaxID=3154259 RepID=UPI0033329F0F
MYDDQALAGLVQESFGQRPVGATRLRGGSKKGVYRLTFDDGSTAVLYVWHESENYWPASAADDGPLSDASGLDLFEAGKARLDSLGVRTPHVHAVRRPDLALVEDVRGGTLESRLEDDPVPALRRLAAGLEAMRQHQDPRLGKVGLLETEPQDRSCQRIVLDRAERDLREAASRVDAVADARDRLENLLHRCYADVRPRSGHSLIHGELGPDHVLVDERGEPVLIDIEGTMFFDVEWEHVFLQMRFGDHYRWLRADGLDEARMEFYRLAMHLSLVAGPLRLLDGDFPDREGMLGIVRHNLERVLAYR